MRFRPLASVLAVAFFSFVPCGKAQVATGIPPFGSFGGGPEEINLANLNVHTTIPVFQKKGRGLPVSLYVTQDSAVWYPVPSGGTYYWYPVTGWGWGQSEANIGSVTYSESSNSREKPCDGLYAEVTTTTYTNWRYTDGFNTSHLFPITTTATYDSCTDTWTYTSGQGSATDGSGYTLSVTTGNQISKLTDIRGSVINPYTGSGSLVDRNGNLVSLDNGVVTDTLGMTALTIAGSGAPSSPNTFTYQAPSGANATYKEIFTSETIQTKFGCTGVSEYGPTAANLITEIDLPDIAVNPGDKYVITYETTPGDNHTPHYVTGRIVSITLPTGGSIEYSYSGGSNGIVCADGSTATLTRTTPDGTWTYTHSENGTAWTTTITDPQNNLTTMNFQGIYETERQTSQGGTVLQTVYTCYNGAAAPCNSTAITLPITQRTVTAIWPNGSGTLQSKTVASYNGYGLPTEVDDYAYASGAPGALARKTLTAYASLGNNIVNKPSSITNCAPGGSASACGGSGTVVAQTVYCYDEATPSGSTTCGATGSPTPTAGTPQHVSVSGSRGNATTINRWVSGSTYLSKKFTYYDTGNVNVATDVNNGTTTYNYANATVTCGNSFPSSVSEAISGLSQSFTWNCTGAVELTATDENGNSVTASYTDADFWRANSVQDQMLNTTNFTYTGQTSAESSMVFGSSTTDVLDTVDSLGRRYIAQKRQSPSGNYDSVQTEYDPLGRPTFLSLPYTASGGATCSGTCPGTTTTYDALGRPTSVTDSAGLNTKYTYTANDVLEDVGPAPSGENTKRKQYEYDALGRLTSVCEITNVSGSGPCGQNTAATGFVTQYTYDALDDLTGVTQNAQSSSTQTRAYWYDGLRRMTQELNPETGSGMTVYAYDSDSTCGTSTGELVKKLDQVGDVICYTYDAMHRPTSAYAASGSYASSTPYKYLIYDSATVNGVSMSNAKARLAEAYTSSSACPLPCSSKITDEGFSYDARGEVSDLYESTPHSGGYFHMNQTYWPNGVTNALVGKNPSGTNQYTAAYGLDGEGRVSSAGYPAGSTNMLTSTSYNSASEPLQVNFASGDSDAFSYDPNSYRMTQYTFSVNGQSAIGKLTWNSNATLQQLAITDPFNSPDNQTCKYGDPSANPPVAGYDDLGRLISANCNSTPPFSGTYTYDAFGNLQKSGTDTFQPTYNSTTNQMSSIGGQTPSYDANGNVTNDFLNSYSWDAYGRPITVDGAAVTYDALGRMVEQNKSGTYTQIYYSPSGFKMLYMDGSTFVKDTVPLPGGTAEWWTPTTTYYRHSDWLGSSRLASTTSRTVYYDGAYGPFGEPYAGTGTTDLNFTGMNQDTASNVYDFPSREYGIQGRWPSPDPAGISATNPAEPQSWNRYAYVLNNPLGATDPSGQRPADECYECYLDQLFFGGDLIDMAGAGGGGVIFGCDEFDAGDSNSYCSTTVLPIADGTYSTTEYQYTGPASGGQTVTFDTWDQYAGWLTSVAAGAPDPCVFSNYDSSGNYTGSYSVDQSMNQQGCAAAGGQWVSPGLAISVNPHTGVATGVPQRLSPGFCHAMGAAAADTDTIGGGLLVVGTGLDFTGVGAPAGVALQLGGAAIGFGGLVLTSLWAHYCD